MTVNLYSKDGAKRACLTNGSGQVVTLTTKSKGTSKLTMGAQAPDGSIYMTLTDGAGNNI